MTTTTPHTDELATRIQRTLDLEAIRTLQFRYACLVDEAVRQPGQAGAEAVADLFTADATADYGHMGVLRGREEIVRHYEFTIPAQLLWVMHLLSNPIVEVTGDRARAQWCFHALALLHTDPHGDARSFIGRYGATYVSTPDGWRIESLVAQFEHP